MSFEETINTMLPSTESGNVAHVTSPWGERGDPPQM